MGVTSQVVRRLLGDRVTAATTQVQAAEPSLAASDLPLGGQISKADEYFRRLYTSMKLGSARVLAITSATDGEGKSTVVLGLAVTLAQDFPERRVALVETDLRRPTLAADFGLPPTPGLADTIVRDQPVRLAYRPTALPNLVLVPAGGPTGNPSTVVRSERLREAVATARRDHDVVILDLPAVLVDSNALAVAELADAVVFVVRAGRAPGSAVRQALAELDTEKLRGIVLNGTRSAIPDRLRRLLGL